MASQEIQAPNTPPDRAFELPEECESSVDLLQRAQRGDREALDRLIQRYAARLRRWAHRRLPQWTGGFLDTEDIVQETLMGTVSRIEAFDAQWAGAFHAYLRKALQNRVRSEVRRARLVQESVSSMDELAGAQRSPLEELIGLEAIEGYEAALARLRRHEREAIIARVELGCSYMEIAAALGKPNADAARMLVRRAIVRLAKEMRRGHR